MSISVGNTTFCGLRHKWIARFDYTVLLIMAILPVSIYWLVVLITLNNIYKEARKAWCLYNSYVKKKQKKPKLKESFQFIDFHGNRQNEESDFTDCRKNEENYFPDCPQNEESPFPDAR